MPDPYFRFMHESVDGKQAGEAPPPPRSWRKKEELAGVLARRKPKRVMVESGIPQRPYGNFIARNVPKEKE